MLTTSTGFYKIKVWYDHIKLLQGRNFMKRLVCIILGICMLFSVFASLQTQAAGESYLFDLNKTINSGVKRISVMTQRDNVFDVNITASKVMRFSGKTFVLKFDTNSAFLNKISKQYVKPGKNIITFISNANGIIKFKISDDIAMLKKYSGTVNVFEFISKGEKCIFEFYEDNNTIANSVTAGAVCENNTAVISGTSSSEKVDITIYDKKYRIVDSLSVECENGSYACSYPISSLLSEGVYFVSVSGKITEYTSFNYEKIKEPENRISETIRVNGTKGDDKITIYGTYSGNENIPLPIALYDADNNLIDFKHLSVDGENKFTHSYDMTGGVLTEGRYTAFVSGSLAKEAGRYSFYIYKNHPYAISGEAAVNENEITVSGHISESEKRIISILLKNEMNMPIYFAQVQTDLSGQFNHTFAIKKYLPKGTYSLYFGSQYSQECHACSFYYDPFEYKKDVDYRIYSSDNETLKVRVDAKANDNILILLKDESGNPVNLKQIEYRTTDNVKTHVFKLSCKQSRTITVTISGAFINRVEETIDNPCFDPSAEFADKNDNAENDEIEQSDNESNDQVNNPESEISDNNDTSENDETEINDNLKNDKEFENENTGGTENEN